MSLSQGGYASSSKIEQNSWITPPDVPDPDNLPESLGWTFLVRPYPLAQDEETSSIILPDSELDYLTYTTNIARVVSVGPCCWTREEHKDKDGNRFDWVKPGDFVTYPKNVGARRKFKGVSYVLLVDDEAVERLPDPQVFDDDLYKINIPMEDLEKYNTIYNKEYLPEGSVTYTKEKA